MSLRPDSPDFLDLPWDLPVERWVESCTRLEELPRGLSRHPVVFVSYGGIAYAIKEMPESGAEREYSHLLRLEDLNLPVVRPVGFARTRVQSENRSILITRYLENALPYSALFRAHNLLRYREYLLDALAGLLVQLHMNGIFWGDCSLYNTLFRRDAGRLQAYLVDAETAEIHSSISESLRQHDLDIMRENVVGGLMDLRAAGVLIEDYPVIETGESIQERYRQLWNEITRDLIISPNEKYRIQERISALNTLGFSVSEVELQSTDDGDQLRLSVVVADRNFHRHQLHSLCGIHAEETQALQLMNEIKEVKATLTAERKRSVPLSVAAFFWQNQYYSPAVERLAAVMGFDVSEPEMYCQFLEHKWFLSERAAQDVGRENALTDLLENPPR